MHKEDEIRSSQGAGGGLPAAGTAVHGIGLTITDEYFGKDSVTATPDIFEKRLDMRGDSIVSDEFRFVLTQR